MKTKINSLFAIYVNICFIICFPNIGKATDCDVFFNKGMDKVINGKIHDAYDYLDALKDCDPSDNRISILNFKIKEEEINLEKQAPVLSHQNVPIVKNNKDQNINSSAPIIHSNKVENQTGSVNKILYLIIGIIILGFTLILGYITSKQKQQTAILETKRKIEQFINEEERRRNAREKIY